MSRSARRGELVAYGKVLSDVATLLASGRSASTRAVNSMMTATSWFVGRRIVEGEQQGAGRAAYGERLIERLSDDLSMRFGRGFGRRNLEQMRSVYLAHADASREQPRDASRGTKAQTPSALSLAAVARALPLP